MTRAWVAVALALTAPGLLSACSGSPPLCADCTNEEDKYLRSLVAGSWDDSEELDDETAAWFVDLGNLTCDLLKRGEDSDYVSESYVDLYGLTQGTANLVVMTAMRNLCPEVLN